MTNSLQYVKAAKVVLKDRPEFDEAWLRDIIAKDSSILGLGELAWKQSEKIQPKAGRLDLLFEDQESEPVKRYEVEIMLGRVDESHIIRTIEYWDIERKRLPQFAHCAVLVAEEITSRFLNVISLFHGAIPMMGLQLNACQIDGKLILNFTRVLDEIIPGAVEEEELLEKEVTDRAYWIEKGSETSMELADQCIAILQEIDSSFTLSYNKHYIGLKRGNRPNNIIVFRARKRRLRIEIRVEDLEALRDELQQTDLEVLGIDGRWRRLRVVVNKGDVTSHHDLLKSVFLRAYKEQAE
ncbi:MAG TPA: hypothetical protein VJO53_12355 [Candidatus Acidoferrales bacterium]|nr:hypothetical protein [Candidatus Acidoferrales bacterium]